MIKLEPCLSTAADRVLPGYCLICDLAIVAALRGGAALGHYFSTDGFSGRQYLRCIWHHQQAVLALSKPL